MPLPKKQRRLKKWFKKFLLAAFVLVLVVILCRHSIISTIAGQQVLTIGTVSRTTTLDGILIKNERVFKAPCSGRLHLTRADGERLEMGARAAEIISVEQGSSEATFVLYTDATGILCNHLDGYESILSPSDIGTIAVPAIEKKDARPLADGSKVDQGQPVVKIIDNLSPVYIYGTLPKTDFTDSYWDDPGPLPASWENMDFSITPGEVNDISGNVRGAFMLSGFPEQIIHHRRVSLNVTTRSLRGFLVPDWAIVCNDHQPGIYLIVKKKAVWTPVEIEGALSGKIAVSGDGIEEGAGYVANPVFVREGWLME